MLGVLIVLMQTAIYAVYFKRKYQWIDTSVESNMGLLENRRYYQVQQLAGLVFNSTDTFVLSIFCGLKVASVYTVYNMVYSACHRNHKRKHKLCIGTVLPQKQGRFFRTISGL